jgi:hypothetical protein
MSYPAYGNIIVDSPNIGGLGGTLSITNSGNTSILNTQSSIGFGIVKMSYNTIQNGLYNGNVDTACARISAVIDRVTPTIGTSLVMSVAGNEMLPPTEAMRIASNGNVVVQGNLNVGFINGTAITSLGGASQWTTTGGNIFYMGNVGIGVQAPQYALDVSNTGIRSTSVVINGTAGSSSVSTGALQVNGGVGIRGNLNVGGNITGGNLIGYALFVSSDYRLKDNIQPLTISRTVDVLKPVEYDHINTGHQMGFIAHELQEQYPFLVSGEKDGEDYQTVNYNGLIALLVKEIQDIKKRLDAANI